MVAFSITSSGSSQRPDSGVLRNLLLVAGALSLVGCGAETNEWSGKKEKAPAVSPIELASIEELDPDALEKLAKSGKVRLIDVRTDAEVADGMIPGAEHIELAKFDPAKLDLSDGREPVLYCRSGNRSSIAAEKLAKHLGKPAKHLDGGINSWREKGLPVSRPAVF